MKALHAVVLVLVTLFATGCAGLKGQQDERPVVIQPIPIPPAEDGTTPDGTAAVVDLGSDRWNRIFELGLAIVASFFAVNVHRDRKAVKAKAAKEG